MTNLANDERLSPLAREILATRHAEAYGNLVPTGAAGEGVRSMLTKLNATNVLAGPVPASSSSSASRDDAAALVSGLWLWHDFLDESHAISQGLHSASGSYWHAIMHRREGDFSNAKYWYARCRNHPAVADVAAWAGEAWEPNAFVDLVERVHDHPNDPRYARAATLQRLEWAALFEHCLRAATRG